MRRLSTGPVERYQDLIGSTDEVNIFDDGVGDFGSHRRTPRQSEILKGGKCNSQNIDSAVDQLSANQCSMV